MLEQTLIIIKPDGVARGLIGQILERFENRQFKVKQLKFVRASEEQLKKHYGEHESRPYFENLISYMNSGPIVIIVLEGPQVISSVRKMIGLTNPADALPGTIRGDFCNSADANVIHASDNLEAAHREIKLWLTDIELQNMLAICDQ